MALPPANSLGVLTLALNLLEVRQARSASWRQSSKKKATQFDDVSPNTLRAQSLFAAPYVEYWQNLLSRPKAELAGVNDRTRKALLAEAKIWKRGVRPVSTEPYTNLPHVFARQQATFSAFSNIVRGLEATFAMTEMWSYVHSLTSYAPLEEYLDQYKHDSRHTPSAWHFGASPISLGIGHPDYVYCILPDNEPALEGSVPEVQTVHHLSEQEIEYLKCISTPISVALHYQSHFLEEDEDKDDDERLAKGAKAALHGLLGKFIESKRIYKPADTRLLAWAAHTLQRLVRQIAPNVTLDDKVISDDQEMWTMTYRALELQEAKVVKLKWCVEYRELQIDRLQQQLDELQTEQAQDKQQLEEAKMRLELGNAAASI